MAKSIKIRDKKTNMDHERKIQEKLEWIDQRITKYLKLLTDVVRFYNKAKAKEAAQKLRTALRIAFFYDFYAETGDKAFRKEGAKYKVELYEAIPIQQKNDLEKIEHDIIRLFEQEKQLATKMSIGAKITTEELSKYWIMKSIDAIYYSRIINGYLKDEDITPSLHAYTQILDMLLDIREYEEDLVTDNPNMLKMRLYQLDGNNSMPQTKIMAIRLAKQLRVDERITEDVDKIISRLGESWVGGDILLTAALKRRAEIITELKNLYA